MARARKRVIHGTVIAVRDGTDPDNFLTQKDWWDDVIVVITADIDITKYLGKEVTFYRGIMYIVHTAPLRCGPLDTRSIRFIIKDREE